MGFSTVGVLALKLSMLFKKHVFVGSAFVHSVLHNSFARDTLLLNIYAVP